MAAGIPRAFGVEWSAQPGKSTPYVRVVPSLTSRTHESER
jgi:hypothetical protein